MKRSSILIVHCFVLVLFLISCSNTPKADLILHNGKIATVDEAFNIEEAVAVRRGKIIFVGSDSEITTFRGPKTESIDLQGQLVLPGLIDAHGHISSLGMLEERLDFRGTTSYQQIIDMVANKVKAVAPGEWILGDGWDQNNWPDKKLPIHDPLSAVSPDNPVYMPRIDGNSVLVNQKAMEMAGIHKGSSKIEGGTIRRKANGEPTGVLVNKAAEPVERIIPEDDISESQFRDRLVKGVKRCLEVGLTGVHDANVSPRTIGTYKHLVDHDLLDMRIYGMLLDPAETRSTRDVDLVEFFRENKLENYGNHMLSIRSIKVFFDGALGSRGAAFYDDYEDDPGNNGLLRIGVDHLYDVMVAALQTGMQVNVHAIGTRGNTLFLDACEQALKQVPTQDHRFRSEHAEVIRPDDIARFTSLEVIPSMQPVHCTSDMVFMKDRIGTMRSRWASPWRSFIEAGHAIPCGSDFPVESHNPLWGIYAAVTRQDHDGLPEKGWFPEQRMTIEEAIRGYTIWAAYGAFQETVLGSIEKGKLADFTVLDKDILEIEPKEILDTKVVYTIVDGKIRYPM